MEGFETYSWENQLEADYRAAIVEIAQNVAEILATTEDIARTAEKDYSPVKKELRKIQRQHKSLAVPSMYEDSDSFIAQALDSYLKGADILIAAVKADDPQQVYRAARYVTDGSSFISISKNRMWEAIEERQKETIH
jgi:hypothetical protein